MCGESLGKVSCFQTRRYLFWFLCPSSSNNVKKVRFPIDFLKPIDISQRNARESFIFCFSRLLWPSLAQRKVSFPNFLAFFYSNPSTLTKSRSHWFSVFYNRNHSPQKFVKESSVFFVKSIVKKCFLSNIFFEVMIPSVL